MNIQDLQATIDVAWEHRAKLDPTNAPELRASVEQVIRELNAGRIRVAERQGVGQWTRMTWNDGSRQLTIEPGGPDGGRTQARAPATPRTFKVLLLPEGTTKDVTYTGRAVSVTM